MFIVKLGGSYKYTIPGFSAITVELQHARVQKACLDGEMELCDVFFNAAEITSTMHLPACVEVIKSCFVKVK